MKKALVTLMGIAVLLVATAPAAADTGLWSSSATAKGGEDTATVNGKGSCQVTAVFVNGRQLASHEYAVENPGNSKPKIHFCQPLPKKAKVVIKGTTTNSGRNQRFSMKLSKSS